jgi:hypothetical protein
MRNRKHAEPTVGGQAVGMAFWTWARSAMMERVIVTTLRMLAVPRVRFHGVETGWWTTVKSAMTGCTTVTPPQMLAAPIAGCPSAATEWWTAVSSAMTQTRLGRRTACGASCFDRKGIFTMKRIHWIAALGAMALLCGCRGGDGESTPTFTLCTGDEDCSEPTPDCRAVDPLETGEPVSLCTRVCTLDEVCFFPGGAEGGVGGNCLGTDTDGKVNPDADEALCFLGCEVVGSTCLLGEGGGNPDAREGRCVLIEYGDQGAVPVCVDVPQE